MDLIQKSSTVLDLMTYQNTVDYGNTTVFDINKKTYYCINMHNCKTKISSFHVSESGFTLLYVDFQDEHVYVDIPKALSRYNIDLETCTEYCEDNPELHFQYSTIFTELQIEKIKLINKILSTSNKIIKE